MEQIQTEVDAGQSGRRVNEEIILTKKQTQEVANSMHKFNTAKSKVVVELAESNFDDKISQKRQIKRKRLEMEK